MEHPLVQGLDKLTEEEILDKISELNKKLAIAARTGNGFLTNQVRMALESYQNRYQSLQQEKNDNNENPFLNRIDIS